MNFLKILNSFSSRCHFPHRINSHEFFNPLLYNMAKNIFLPFLDRIYEKALFSKPNVTIFVLSEDDVKKPTKHSTLIEKIEFYHSYFKYLFQCPLPPNVKCLRSLVNSSATFLHTATVGVVFSHDQIKDLENLVKKTRLDAEQKFQKEKLKTATLTSQNNNLVLKEISLLKENKTLQKQLDKIKKKAKQLSLKNNELILHHKGLNEQNKIIQQKLGNVEKRRSALGKNLNKTLLKNEAQENVINNLKGKLKGHNKVLEKKDKQLAEKDKIINTHKDLEKAISNVAKDADQILNALQELSRTQTLLTHSSKSLSNYMISIGLQPPIFKLNPDNRIIKSLNNYITSLNLQPPHFSS